jgi:pimeloyl-ACP methyl ester carboxylesterase
MQRAAILFIHGLFSSREAWKEFGDLLHEDPEITSRFDLRFFEYPSPKLNLNPRREIPSIDTLADALRTYVDTELKNYPEVVLVAHSQGGLIAQRFIARALNDGRAQDLAQIKLVIQFATPNSGSEFALSLRKKFSIWGNPQETELRPLARSISETLRVVINRAVHARQVTSNQIPIPFVAYAGESDAIVTPQSAQFVFPVAGMLPGNHSSIIRPTSMQHPTYRNLKRNLFETVAAVPANGSIAGSQTTTTSAEAAIHQTPPEPPAVTLGPPDTAASLIVDALLQVPEMTESTVREDIISELPGPIRRIIKHRDQPKQHIRIIVRSCERFANGKLHLKAAIELVLETETPEVQQAFSIIDAQWPTYDSPD